MINRIIEEIEFWKSERDFSKRIKEEDKEAKRRVELNINPANFSLIEFIPEIYEMNGRYVYPKKSNDGKEEIIYFRGAYIIAFQEKDEMEKETDLLTGEEYQRKIEHGTNIYGIIDPKKVRKNGTKLELSKAKEFILNRNRLGNLLQDKIDRMSLDKIVIQLGLNPIEDYGYQNIITI